MKLFKTVLLASALALSANVSTAETAATASLSKADIEKIVHDYLIENPEILMETAWLLYSYKDVPLEQVPEKWREMARCVTDELDRSGFSFSVTEEDGAHIEMHAITNMMHRRYLPGRKLSGSLLPVFAMPNQCKTVVVLPPEYWTRDFKKAWRKGLI